MSYPRPARVSGIQGVVQLTAVITVDGRVEDIKVSGGHGFLLIAAKENLARWLFSGCSSLNDCEVKVMLDFALSPDVCDTEDCPSECQLYLPHKVLVSA